MYQHYIDVREDVYRAYTHYFEKGKQALCGFSMGSNQYLAGRVYDLCVLLYETRLINIFGVPFES